MNRLKQIKQLRKNGLSYSSIGKLFGISRQRVQQLSSGYITTEKRKTCKNKYKELNLLFQSIFERDNFKCQICNKKATLIHHIDRNWQNNNPTNLVSLCNTCHLNLHRKDKCGNSSNQPDNSLKQEYSKDFFSKCGKKSVKVRFKNKTKEEISKMMSDVKNKKLK